LLRFALKILKIADQAIFYPASSVEPKVRSMPDNRDFCVTDDAKIHKCNRLLDVYPALP
jgi:hypothetical protein